MGKGMFCSSVIKKNTFITEYAGEVFYKNSKVLKEREMLYKISSHSYLYKLTKDHIIDATQYGSWGRFINHSCFPNCYIH